MATVREHLKRIKEEPLLDDNVPHPYREVIKGLNAVLLELEDIKTALTPVKPPKPGVRVTTIQIPAIQLPQEDFMKIYIEAMRQFGQLKFANDLHVETIDLSVDRSTDAKIQEFSKVNGIALTIFSNTGTYDLYLNEKTSDHKITLSSLTYPQTLLIDNFNLKTVYIGNAAQSGQSSVLIAWKDAS